MEFMFGAFPTLQTTPRKLKQQTTDEGEIPDCSCSIRRGWLARGGPRASEARGHTTYEATRAPSRATYWLNTNALAGRPEMIEFYKSFWIRAYPEAKAEAALNRPEHLKSPGLKRHEEVMKALEFLKTVPAEPNTNAIVPSPRGTNAPAAAQ